MVGEDAEAWERRRPSFPGICLGLLTILIRRIFCQPIGNSLSVYISGLLAWEGSSVQNVQPFGVSFPTSESSQSFLLCEDGFPGNSER